MIQQVKLSAEEVGINAVVTNSNEKIETQLNRLTREEVLPIMVISWNYDTTLRFNTLGFLENPKTKFTGLLLTKAYDTSKFEMELAASQMGSLFQIFIKNLRDRLVKFQTTSEQPISDAGYVNTPVHGMGKHSGVLFRFTASGEIINCIEIEKINPVETIRGIGFDTIGEDKINY
ncbi:structural protein [Tenacibaculum phage Larrie]|nr:structural protein [Tenacibaculum phage Larrie]